MCVNAYVYGRSMSEYERMYLCLGVCPSVYVCLYALVYVFMFVCICLCVYVYVYVMCLCVSVCVYLRICECTYESVRDYEWMCVV